MKKVYVITSGSYSDYHIHAVCSTRVKAAYACKQISGANNPEEFTIDDPAVCLPKDYYHFLVSMTKDGDGKAKKTNSDEQTGNKVFISKDKETATFSLIAKDEQHALKIANEMRAQLIATQQW